ncbi:hypothetical protein B0T17DRAFT_590868 [Bombardia bombarda]|uniref:Uncharacterized protein n=1 Tax=Bombardia bombarda TaxID=252184 RepID=A0AA40C5Q7_9PEZI|nr:hypothetical protein B0T17DRAFT_590868 [Bombardia bombarda]
MWPATPKLKVARSVGPSSPPQTPTTAPPGFSRQSSTKVRAIPPHNPHRPMAPDSRSRTAGTTGPDFTFTRAIRPEQLSPRSSSMSSSASSSSSSPSSESGASAANPSRSATPEQQQQQQQQQHQHHQQRRQQPRTTAAPTPPAPATRTGRIVTQAAFVVEELSDFEGSDEERLDVIRPHTIEYAESDRSRSRSRNPPEIDPTIMQNLGNLNCSDDSDQTDFDEAEYREFLIRRRDQKRHKRMTSGSIGKRTISESIGSDTDREDLKAAFLGADEVGSSARRLRRRVGDRRSLQLQFQDPPPPRIDELDEPDSSEDEILISETLARELPYYEYISMEVDSPQGHSP